MDLSRCKTSTLDSMCRKNRRNRRWMRFFQPAAPQETPIAEEEEPVFFQPQEMPMVEEEEPVPFQPDNIHLEP